jgi:hypothetical protein
MGKVSPKKIEELIKKGRLVPIIQSNNEGKHFLVGYKRKSTSRKSKDTFMLPEPEEIQVPNFQKNNS